MESKEMVSYSDLPVYNENPFSRKMKDAIKFSMKKTFMKPVNGVTRMEVANLANGETGEVNTAFFSSQKRDNAQFTKLYADGLRVMLDLSLTEVKVFLYILGSLRVDSDYVYVNRKDAMEMCGYKQPNQYYRGITGLVQRGVIALSDKENLIYINPQYIFNGNRFYVIKEIIKNDNKMAQIAENPEQHTKKENQDWPKD